MCDNENGHPLFCISECSLSYLILLSLLRCLFASSLFLFISLQDTVSVYVPSHRSALPSESLLHSHYVVSLLLVKCILDDSVVVFIYRMCKSEKLIDWFKSRRRKKPYEWSIYEWTTCLTILFFSLACCISTNLWWNLLMKSVYKILFIHTCVPFMCLMVFFPYFLSLSFLLQSFTIAIEIFLCSFDSFNKKLIVMCVWASFTVQTWTKLLNWSYWVHVNDMEYH